MNKIIILGRFCKDPEVSSSASGTTFARFSIAVDRRFKREGEPEADFFNCSAFGKTAEFIEKYMKKGSKVCICGRLENNNYTNKDGQKVYDVRIMVEEIDFAESKGETKTESKDVTELNITEQLPFDLPFS
jgi:single-strand DNA-binding protein